MTLQPFPYELVRSLLALPLQLDEIALHKELSWLCHEYFGQVSVESSLSPATGASGPSLEDVGALLSTSAAAEAADSSEVQALAQALLHQPELRPHFHLVQTHSDWAPMHLQVSPGDETGWRLHWRKELAQIKSPQDLHFVCDWLASAVCKCLSAPFRVHVNQAVGAWDAAGRPNAKVALVHVAGSEHTALHWEVWVRRQGRGWRVRLEMSRC